MRFFASHSNLLQSRISSGLKLPYLTRYKRHPFDHSEIEVGTEQAFFHALRKQYHVVAALGSGLLTLYKYLTY
jgi:hypothetical protein